MENLNSNTELEVKDTMSSLELLEQINYFRNEIDGKKELKHKTLLEIIRNEFEEEINEQKILPVKYKDKKGEERPMYILNLSQAKQVLIRESKSVRKAVIKYIEKLEDKIRNQVKPMTPMELLELQFQFSKEIHSRVEKVEDDISTIRDSMTVSRTNWRKETNRLIKRMNLTTGMTQKGISVIRTLIYQELEDRANCNLSARLNHKIKRMTENGVTKSKIDLINNLDVIEDDSRLTEIYISIVKEFAVKYGLINE